MARAKTKVILQQSYPSLGLVGDIVAVSPGYFRNFLEPKKIALVANPRSIKELEHNKKIVEAKKAKEAKSATAIQAQIEAKTWEIEHAAGTSDRLFGSVTNVEVQALLKDAGIDIDKKLIQVHKPIKTLGEHEIKIRLHHDVIATAKVNVLKKESKEEAQENSEVQSQEAAS